MIIWDSSATSFGEDLIFMSAEYPLHLSRSMSYIALTLKPFLSKFLQTASPKKGRHEHILLRTVKYLEFLQHH